MKSRVRKYADLHQKIASDTESTVENSDLSHFANRLSEIDDQFERVHTSKQALVSPSRARKNDHEELEKVDPIVDTFETHYLKDFLEEVKEYNVKKGYRDISDTQANILDDLRGELKDSAMDNLEFEDDIAQDLEATQSIYSEKELAKIAEAIFEDEQNDLKTHRTKDEIIHDDEILVFGEEISNEVQDESPKKEFTLEEDDSEEFSDEATISMAIHDMSYDNEGEDNLELDTSDKEFINESKSYEPRDQELFEQTQTMQHKIFDLENNLEEMSSTTIKTNRLLHVVLSLLLFAIIVVALLITAQII